MYTDFSDWTKKRPQFVFTHIRFAKMFCSVKYKLSEKSALKFILKCKGNISHRAIIKIEPGLTFQVPAEGLEVRTGHFTLRHHESVMHNNTTQIYFWNFYLIFWSGSNSPCRKVWLRNQQMQVNFLPQLPSLHQPETRKYLSDFFFLKKL